MGDADTARIQKLIKQVIEATRCSPAQAELALYDNDNNIFAAAEYILDKGVNIESWTQHKTKKDKKKDEDERKVIRGAGSYRGRGVGPSDGRRNSTAADRSASDRRGPSVSSRGEPMRGRGSLRGGRGKGNMPRQWDSGRSQQRPGVLKSIDLNEDPSNRKTGSLEFKHSDVVASAPPSSCNGSSIPTGSITPSISFAAVAAAAVRKEHQKNQPPVEQPTVVAEPARCDPTPEPAVIEPLSNEPVNDTNFTHEPSPPPSNTDDLENTAPVNREESVDVASVTAVQPTSPQKLQTASAWTIQLKSDLGISATTAATANVSPVKSQQVPPALPGVEFATETIPAGLADYHFGFVEPAPPVPAAPVPSLAPSVESSSPSAESLFAVARQSSPVKAPVKTSEIHPGSGEYPVKANSPPAASASPSQNRHGLVGTSAVSYSSSSTAMETRTQNVPKSHGHMAAAPSQVHQQQHQPQQQQAMFPSPIPFSYPNPYMYSPISNMRAEDYAALLQQYPFTMPGMDMANMANLMGGAGFPQTTGSQSLSNQHRQDSHGMDNTMKSHREQTQQVPPVQPPPGFGGNPFGMQPQMNMMQQHYNPQQYSPFMMANMGALGGRQMYAQDDERKSYDKMSGAKMQTQQTHPYPAGGHYGMGNTKKYNWNS